MESEDVTDAADVVAVTGWSCCCSASLTFDPFSVTSHRERFPEAPEEEPREEPGALPELDVGVACEICRSSTTDRKLNTENLSRFTLGSPTMFELIIRGKQTAKKECNSTTLSVCVCISHPG